MYKYSFEVLEKGKYEDFSDVKYSQQVIIYCKNSTNALEKLKEIIPAHKIIKWNCEELLEQKDNKIAKLNFTGNGQVDYTSVIPKINELIDEVNKLKGEK